MKCGDTVKAREYSIEFLDKCSQFSDCHLAQCTPENVCPIVLHTLVPYYFTYAHEGDFSWTKETGHVDVRCPNAKGSVVGDVANDDEVSFEIQSAEASCPMSYKKGMKVNVGAIFEKLCPLVYDVAYSWIQLGINDSIVLRCPGCSGTPGLKFILRRKDETK